MNLSESVFKIIEEKKCPLYKIGDEFILSDHILLISDNKPTCIILILDLTEILANINSLSKSEPVNEKNASHSPSETADYDAANLPHIFDCSGCSGIIRLAWKKQNKSIDAENTNIDTIAALLKSFSFFQDIDKNDINELIPLLKIKKFVKGDIIIKKGDPASNLFIILSGKIDVLIGDVPFGYLGRGEVFGEISILVGTPATTTISVAEPATVLMMRAGDFKNILKKFPSLQMYFARLLAQRLAKTNIERLEDFEAGISGKLSEIYPAELFQVMNLNHKTGILKLTLLKGSACVAFREGELVRVEYNNKKGEEAFFEILNERKGRFKFSPGLPSDEMNLPEIGDFMWLLMQALNRIDEGK